MDTIEIKTLIDITNPAITRPTQGTELEQKQYKNWNTFRQCIELRSIIDFNSNPSYEVVDVKNLGFGTEYKGKQKVWTFTFNTDRIGAYDDEDGNILGLLYQDLSNVPIIEKLTETINISKAVFDLETPQFKNTLISAPSRHILAQYI